MTSGNSKIWSNPPHVCRSASVPSTENRKNKSNVLLLLLCHPNGHWQHSVEYKFMSWCVHFPRIISALFFQYTKGAAARSHVDILQDRPGSFTWLARLLSFFIHQKQIWQRRCLWKKDRRGLTFQSTKLSTICTNREVYPRRILKLQVCRSMIWNTVGAALNFPVRTTTCGSGLQLPIQHPLHFIHQNSAKATSCLWDAVW